MGGSCKKYAEKYKACPLYLAVWIEITRAFSLNAVLLAVLSRHNWRGCCIVSQSTWMILDAFLPSLLQSWIRRFKVCNWVFVFSPPFFWLSINTGAVISCDDASRLVLFYPALIPAELLWVSRRWRCLLCSNSTWTDHSLHMQIVEMYLSYVLVHVSLVSHLWPSLCCFLPRIISEVGRDN